MKKFSEHMNESFDKVLPVRRDIPPQIYVFDQWLFDMGSRTYAVRFLHAAKYGKKVTEVKIGVIKARKVSSTLASVSDIKLFMASALAAVDAALADPTKKIKPRMYGFVLNFPNKIFEVYGNRINRILFRYFRKRFNVEIGLNDNPFDENWSSIYIYKKGRKFDQVFTELNFDVAAPEPEAEVGRASPAPAAATVYDTPAAIQADPEVSNDPTEVEIEPNEPVDGTAASDIEYTPPTKEVDPPSVISDLDRKTYYKSLMTAVPVKEKYKDNLAEKKREAMYKAYYMTLLRKSYGDDDESVPVNLSDDEFRLASIAQAEGEELKIAEKKLLIVLNYHGIMTKDIYDTLRDKSYASNDYIKDNFGREIKSMWDLRPGLELRAPTEWPFIYKKMLNYKEEFPKIMKELGVETITEPKYGDKESKVGLALYKAKQHDDPQVMKDAYLEAAMGLPGDLPREKLFKDEESGKKTIRRLNVYSDDYGDVRSLFDGYLKLIEDPNEALEFYDAAPNYIQAAEPFFSKDYEVFEASFINLWLLTGGTEAHGYAYHASKDLRVNKQLEEYWNPIDPDHQNMEFNKNRHQKMNNRISSMVEADPRFTGNFNAMYQKTQEFYKNKFKKKYDTKTVKLYRGIGVDEVEKYIPSTIESWSSQMSTAKRFAKMMSRHQYSVGTVLYAEVPIQYVIGSFEALGDVFADDSELKGKKEFMVMGGAFATVPIYEYNVSEKAPTDKVLSFAEWADIMESVNKDKSIKVVKPSEKDSKTGTGWQENEHLTKGYKDDKKNSDEQR